MQVESELDKAKSQINSIAKAIEIREFNVP